MSVAAMRRLDEWSHIRRSFSEGGGQNPAYRPSGLLPDAHKFARPTQIDANVNVYILALICSVPWQANSGGL